MTKLSILIPSISKRKNQFANLINELNLQRSRNDAMMDVEVIVETDNGEMKIGDKRNLLLHWAVGEYLCFFDDDDFPGENYIKNILEGIDKDVDSCSLRGIITVDGGAPEIFEHSIIYKEWKTTDNQIKYERYPNHLNAIKSSIAKQFKFPSINDGEDHNWSTQIFDSKLIKTEHYIDEVIYNYNYISNK